jgi:hypothetical protein
MPTEQITVIVSVNADADEEARIQQINKQVGRGWRVLQVVPVEGSTAGPGGKAMEMMRLQVTLQREIEPQDGSNVGAVRIDREESGMASEEE